MFSPKIQNLINSSGQQAAIQRYAEINTQIANFEKGLQPPSLDKDIKPFAKVLKDRSF